MNSRAWSRSPACSPSWKARPDICITAKPTGALWEPNSCARTVVDANRIASGIRNAMVIRPIANNNLGRVFMLRPLSDEPDRRSDSPPSVWCPAPGSARLKDSYRAARPTPPDRRRTSDPEAGSLRVQLEEVGRRVCAGVRDVLRRDEHPHAIRVDVGVEGELHPVERPADDLDPFTQGAVAVVGVVCQVDDRHGLEWLPHRARRATPAQFDVALGAVLAAGAVGVGEVLG